MSLLAEIPEADATGDLARIYEEMRVYCAVPYVSTLQRHVATMPGCLEWVWSALRPGFVSGDIPETAWRLTKVEGVPPLPPLSDSALRLMGVDEAAAETLAQIYSTYVRVSPINLLFSDSLRLLLTGSDGGGQGEGKTDWTPPAMFPPPPPMLDLDGMEPNRAAVLMRLGAQGPGGQIMVAGLYRYMATWPAYLAHAATLLHPLFDEPAVKQACDAIARRITAAAPDVVARLPKVPDDLPRPTPEQVDAIIPALDMFKKTSPEMIVFGTLLRDALPNDGESDG